MGESPFAMDPSDGRPRRHYAYLLRCADGTYYAGYTVDPARRFGAHRRGRASRYTRGRGPHRLVAVWRCPTQRAALRLERMLKRLSHAAKERLAAGQVLARVAVRARGIGARRHIVW
ncbi:MAG TPA: GIY-YIG nuclease family protein [bacterium]|nr:GIY-YIG nuclease family protein [bacterium]